MTFKTVEEARKRYAMLSETCEHCKSIGQNYVCDTKHCDECKVADAKTKASYFVLMRITGDP
jgi:hypothetical protein